MCFAFKCVSVPLFFGELGLDLGLDAQDQTSQLRWRVERVKTARTGQVWGLKGAEDEAAVRAMGCIRRQRVDAG